MSRHPTTLSIGLVSREVETVKASGKVKEPWSYTVLTLETANGVLRIELDSGDFSKMLASPGTKTLVSGLTQGPIENKGSAA
jgi:hypothetical protein